MKINFILSSPEIHIIFRTHGMTTELKATITGHFHGIKTESCTG